MFFLRYLSKRPAQLVEHVPLVGLGVKSGFFRKDSREIQIDAQLSLGTFGCPSS
jgi:hypothetical protein